MNISIRWFANSIMLLAVLCGAGSIALFAFAPAGSLRVMEAQWPVAGVLCWDALLSLGFFLQHSGMVRRGFRARLARSGLHQKSRRMLDRLLFDILWTAWICVGTIWEETDLTNEFGDAYRQYRRAVPMLIPWRAVIAPQSRETFGHAEGVESGR